MQRGMEQDSPCPQWGGRGEETAGGEWGQEEGMAIPRANPDGGLGGPERLWSSRKYERHFLLGNIFIVNLKRQGSGKATLQIAEAAYLCPEEAQRLALTTNFSRTTSGRFLKIPLTPFPLCSEAFWALRSGPGTQHMSLWTTVQAFCTLTSIEVGRAEMRDLCSALWKHKQLPTVNSLSPGFRLRISTGWSGRSGTALRSHWSVGA